MRSTQPARLTEGLITKSYAIYSPHYTSYLRYCFGIAFAVWFFFFKKGNLKFWKVASKYPNEAYEWFIREECWIVIDLQSSATEKPDPREFNGPFWLKVPKLGGRIVNIYGHFDEIEDSQKRFLKTYK